MKYPLEIQDSMKSGMPKFWWSKV